MTATPSIPSWEWTELQNLGTQGDLSGVAPIVLGAIDQAESSGGGGGINSEGYGGWFGLSSHAKYPTGSTSPALLQGTDTASFDTQAEIAAGEFASLLTAQGGDPIKAEEVYQSGSASGPTEGSKILSALLGTGSATSGSSNGTGATAVETSSLNANPLDLFGIPAAGASAVGSDLSKVASALWGDVSKYVLTLAFVGAGLALVVVGIKGLGEDAHDEVDGGGGAPGGLTAPPAEVAPSAPKPPPTAGGAGVVSDLAPLAVAA